MPGRTSRCSPRSLIAYGAPGSRCICFAPGPSGQCRDRGARLGLARPARRRQRRGDPHGRLPGAARAARRPAGVLGSGDHRACRGAAAPRRDGRGRARLCRSAGAQLGRHPGRGFAAGVAGSGGRARVQGRMTAARRILILAPHPDDEVASCGIAALRARASGARVFVFYLTTGVPERAALWAWQRPRYAARVRRRRAEAQEAAALLGLEPVGFRDTPSRRLRADLDRAAAELDAALAACGAEALWVPAFEGGHQDHDAANALAAGVRHRLPVWEFAAYNFFGGQVRANRFAALRGGEVAIEATAAEARVKRRVLECYRSERG